MLQRFRYLSLGLAVVLGFVGIKMLISDVYKISIPLSLGVIVVVLTVAIVWSLRSSRAGRGGPPDPASATSSQMPIR